MYLFVILKTFDFKICKSDENKAVFFFLKGHDFRKMMYLLYLLLELFAILGHICYTFVLVKSSVAVVVVLVSSYVFFMCICKIIAVV